MSKNTATPSNHIMSDIRKINLAQTKLSQSLQTCATFKFSSCQNSRSLTYFLISILQKHIKTASLKPLKRY